MCNFSLQLYFFSTDMVGLLVRWPDDPEHEKVLVFKLISAEPDSASVFAQQVCKQLANLHYMSHHVSCVFLCLQD